MRSKNNRLITFLGGNLEKFNIYVHNGRIIKGIVVLETGLEDP
jgi:hypothetical protein